MNKYILLIISIVCAVLANIVKKHSSTKFQSKTAMRFLFNSIVSLTCVICFLVVGGAPEISGFTVMLGIIFGVTTVLQQFFSLLAYECGPFAYTAVIVSMSTIIPALSGCIFWGEDISTVQIVGMVLMLLCFILSVDFSSRGKKTSPLWFICVLITFVATGLIGVMQKIHQTSPYKTELNGFLITAFLCSFLISALITSVITARFSKEKREALKSKDITAYAFVLMIICGICAAANNKLNLHLSGVMDSAIFFPVVNVGGMLLSALSSFLLFKERLSLQKWLGIFVGIVAVVLLCNPF